MCSKELAFNLPFLKFGLNYVKDLIVVGDEKWSSWSFKMGG